MLSVSVPALWIISSSWILLDLVLIKCKKIGFFPNAKFKALIECNNTIDLVNVSSVEF